VNPYPVEQKQYSKYYAGDAIGSHKSKVNAAQVVWFYKQVLVNKQGAKERDTNLVQEAYLSLKFGHHDKNSRKHM
jgi:hypothetical protein